MKWRKGDSIRCDNGYDIEGRLTAGKYYILQRDKQTSWVAIMDDSGELLGFPAYYFTRTDMPTDAGAEEYDEVMQAMEIVE